MLHVNSLAGAQVSTLIILFVTLTELLGLIVIKLNDEKLTLSIRFTWIKQCTQRCTKITLTTIGSLMEDKCTSEGEHGKIRRVSDAKSQTLIHIECEAAGWTHPPMMSFTITL